MIFFGTYGNNFRYLPIEQILDCVESTVSYGKLFFTKQKIMKRHGILSILIVMQIVFTSFHEPFSKHYSPIEIKEAEIRAQKKDSCWISQIQYEAFTTHLGDRESGSRYWIVNRLGYMGKYQFGRIALRDIGIRTTRRNFLQDTCLQEYAMFKYLEVNDKRLKAYYGKYIDKEIKGVKITKSGLLAGAHLAGAGGVKRFLKSDGRVDRRDANGTRVSDYIRAFGGYEFELNDVAI